MAVYSSLAKFDKVQIRYLCLGVVIVASGVRPIGAADDAVCGWSCFY